MKILKLKRFTITLWWWTKPDKRQKKPTTGFGIIIEW